MSDTDPENQLWLEYQAPFKDFDDHTLARWLCQTLGQLEGRLWRMSHPLVNAYRAAAEQGHARQIWFKRLATIPPAFGSCEACGAPLIPVFTRYILSSGLMCHQCGEPAIEFADIPDVLKPGTQSWASEYAGIHEIAHYDEERLRQIGDYEQMFEQAATDAEIYLAMAAKELLPKFVDYYPALIWEDQDECLEVEPKDIITWRVPGK